MAALVRGRISYSLGKEHKPGGLLARDRLVIESDGRARLAHYGERLARDGWVGTVKIGTVKASALESVWTALERARFPRCPMHVPTPGAEARELAVGPGPASAESAFIAASRKVPGYDDAFAVLDAIVREISGAEEQTPSATTMVDDVTRVHPDDLGHAVTASPGTAFLLAYLPARKLGENARRELLERHTPTAGGPLTKAIANARRAIDDGVREVQLATDRLGQIADSVDFELPAWPTDVQSDPGERWESDLANAFRPRLTGTVLEDAWHAGEAARRVIVCAGLVATIGVLRAAAPDDAKIGAEADELARDLERNAEALKARLETTEQLLIVSHAQRFSSPLDVANLDEDLRKIARAFDAVPPPPAEASIDHLLAMTIDGIDLDALDVDTLERLALQRKDAFLAMAALGEVTHRTNDLHVANRILSAKIWDTQLSANALGMVFGHDQDTAVHHMYILLQDRDACDAWVLEKMAELVLSARERFLEAPDATVVRLLLFRLEKLGLADLPNPDLLRKLRALGAKALAALGG